MSSLIEPRKEFTVAFGGSEDDDSAAGFDAEFLD
jgi:hypothetical protein